MVAQPSQAQENAWGAAVGLGREWKERQNWGKTYISKIKSGWIDWILDSMVMQCLSDTFIVDIIVENATTNKLDGVGPVDNRPSNN